jgi:exopolyphosphatase/guanosine-5'-triphosphate,3'-diphosphate pyrophosphatase
MQEQRQASADSQEAIASIDLGSNSFHLIVVRAHNGDLQVIDKLREMVRLGEGLTPEKNLDPMVAERALACLERFGQRLRTVPPSNVRAVGTNTMRQLRFSDAFLSRAERALGHEIEVIAGREEARLIYLGVAHGLAAGDERRLVVDIGGGSTELIIGEGFNPDQRESLHMGCVSISQGYFRQGQITAKAMKQAELACEVQLQPVSKQFREGGWQRAVGSSGTIKAIREVVIQAGWSEAGITLDALERLKRALVDAGSIDRLQLKGLADERKPVFPGGVAVLLAVFQSIGIERMQVSNEALREGLIYDLLGRSRHEDVRERTIQSLSNRYNIEQVQAKRVDRTAQALFNQTLKSWQLADPEFASMLSWAAQIHEIGLAVSHSSFHKHGAYLIENSDLSGFSRQEQRLLAALVRGHRRKFPVSVFDSLATDLVLIAKRLCILLRLAVLLHRGRSATLKPQTLMEAKGDRISLEFPPGWLEQHPLTQMELAQEAENLRLAGFELTFC